MGVVCDTNAENEVRNHVELVTFLEPGPNNFIEIKMEGTVLNFSIASMDGSYLPAARILGITPQILITVANNGSNMQSPYKAGLISTRKETRLAYDMGHAIRIFGK